MSPATETFETVFEAILEHAAREEPRECCGFIYWTRAGLAVMPVRNSAEDELEFSMSPWDQYNALMDIDRLDGLLVAIYHSHPMGTAIPSERDKEFAALHPGIAMLIAAGDGVRAYRSSGEPF